MCVLFQLGEISISGKNGYLGNIARFNKDSWIVKGLISAQIVQGRNYAASNQGKDKEYEKLWAAVTGGRGTGRGKKKVIVKGVDSELLKFDKAGLKWQGFNAPLRTGAEDPSDHEERPVRVKRTFDRGWTGRSWPGKKCGHPITADGVELTDFTSVVVELRRVSNMTAGGRKKTQRAMVVAGNYNGLQVLVLVKGKRR
ncbi:28S ribosomal protein S5, mitochondrial [Desmophyllum pertusum]|uniref:28S ribosomal protein S5, mitochondrial n=1 Tax=Desmophyllum pertusum TaxID=174260 RepID=A0A9W9YU29_9CNID|nr:28S ribosomal protein S5, mitochondrial [Desmophyllum pertusum]